MKLRQLGIPELEITISCEACGKECRIDIDNFWQKPENQPNFTSDCCGCGILGNGERLSSHELKEYYTRQQSFELTSDWE